MPVQTGRKRVRVLTVALLLAAGVGFTAAAADVGAHPAVPHSGASAVRSHSHGRLAIIASHTDTVSRASLVRVAGLAAAFTAAAALATYVLPVRSRRGMPWSPTRADVRRRGPPLQPTLT